MKDMLELRVGYRRLGKTKEMRLDVFRKKLVEVCKKLLCNLTASRQQKGLPLAKAFRFILSSSSIEKLVHRVFLSRFLRLES